MGTSNGPRLGTTLYSLTNEFHARQFTFEQLVARVAALGLGPCLEIVGFQSIRGFPEVSDEFAGRFRELIAQHGLVPSCLGINADVALRPGQRLTEDESVAYHERQIRAAAKLGFPVARCQFPAGPAVLRRLVPLAEQLNVRLGVEIHAPHHVEHPDILAFREMYAQVGSPYLGFVPDFGASARAVPPSFIAYFREQGIRQDLIELGLRLWGEPGDQFARMATFLEAAPQIGADPESVHQVAIIFGLFSRQDPRRWLDILPQIVHIHAKFYDFDATGDEVAIDYPAHLRLLRDAGYSGSMSSEWEGHMYSDAGGFEKLQAHHALCRRALAAH